MYASRISYYLLSTDSSGPGDGMGYSPMMKQVSNVSLLNKGNKFFFVF